MAIAGSSSVTRRTLLAGAVAGLALAACGDDDDDGGAATGPSSQPDGDAGPDDGKGLALVRFFDDPSTIIGNSRRLVFGLAQADGTLREEGPDTVDGELIDPTGASLGAVVGTRRAKALFRQYYQFRVDVPAEGIYTLRVTSAGETADSSFTVVAPGALAFPSPGDAMEPFDTPTMADPRGVDPVCTRDPLLAVPGPRNHRDVGHARAIGTREVALEVLSVDYRRAPQQMQRDVTGRP